MEDSRIVALFWKREQRAIEEASAKYGGYCASIAARILDSRQDVEESLNDTWLHAWNSMPPHRPDALAPFLGAITRAICLNRWRNMRSQKRGGGEVALAYDELSECIPDGKRIDESLQAEELARALNAFLSELPETERTVFLRRYWYFLPIPEISRSFGFSRSKIKTMLWRTRKKLMNRLIQEGFLDES